MTDLGVSEGVRFLRVLERLNLGFTMVSERGVWEVCGGEFLVLSLRSGEECVDFGFFWLCGV